MLFQFTQKAFYLMALSWLLCLADAGVIPDGFEKRSTGVIKLNFNKVSKGTPGKPPLQNKKRDGSFEYPLINEGVSYIADIYIGSNGQKISVDVDTGSSDLWVIDLESGIDGTYGTYDHTASSSYKNLAPGFSIGYADGSYAKGNWVTDKVALSTDGPSIPALEFGDATDTSIKFGILGIGFNSLEAASTEYNNLPASLKQQGYINKNAYSLYLGSQDAKSGSVLFGGIDNAKYSGSLVSLPITSNDRLNIDVQSFSINGKTTKTGVSTTLDSGSTISYLEPKLLQAFATAAGAKYQDGDSPFYYWDDCSSVGDLTVSFNGVDITVPKDYATGGLTNSDGSTAPGCALLVLPDSRFNILGDNFLRNAYIVYDLEDKTISLAQVKYSDSENITTIS